MTARRLSVSPRTVLWLFVAATLLSLVLVLDSLLYWKYMSGQGFPQRWAPVIVGPISRAFFFVAMAPVVMWVARRAPIGKVKPLSALVLHVLFATVFGFAAVSLYAWLLYGYPLWHPYGRWALIHLPQWMLFYGVVVGATAALDSHARSLAKERHTAQLRVQLAEAQLRALRNQLHPHFVFNTLQAVSTLMYRDTAAADALLGQLSALLRRLLDHLECEQVALAEEFAFIESYLAIERARLGDRLSVSIEMPPALSGCQIPPLLIQPLVENAVKHAVAPRREGGRIALAARRQGAQLEIEVRDDGPGLPVGFGPQQFGVGLRTASSRLNALRGDANGLCLEGAPGCGLVARITLPLRMFT